MGKVCYCTYPDLAPQHRHDFSHHPNQVLIFIGVVCEPNSLTDGQDFFTNVASKEKKKRGKLMLVS